MPAFSHTIRLAAFVCFEYLSCRFMHPYCFLQSHGHVLERMGYLKVKQNGVPLGVRLGRSRRVTVRSYI